MNIVKTQITEISASNIKGLDPLSIYVENIDKGKKHDIDKDAARELWIEVMDL